MLSIDDLTKAPSEEAVLETFLLNLETLGVPARSWRVGGVSRTILRVVARTYAGFAALIALAIKAMFLETSSGAWLTLLAYYVYGVSRVEATFATGQVQLTNGGGGIYTLNPGELRVLWTATGKAYTNTSTFTLNPGDVLLVDVQAVEQGSASSAPVGAVTSFETVLLGVTVTNPAAIVGLDEETDDTLRAACKAKLAALSVRGPRGAYAYAVRVAVRGDGTPVNVNRLQVSASSSTGVVTVYVAAPSGAPDPTDLDYIETSIEDVARPDSVTVNVLAATMVPVTRTLTVWARRVDGVSAADIQGMVETSLVNAIASYPIGGIPKPPSTQGYLYADFLAGTAKGAHVAIFDVDGGGADVALDPGEVATLTATVDVRLVEVP